jgi:hypothetical protein
MGRERDLKTGRERQRERSLLEEREISRLSRILSSPGLGW